METIPTAYFLDRSYELLTRVQSVVEQHHDSFHGCGRELDESASADLLNELYILLGHFEQDKIVRDRRLE